MIIYSRSASEDFDCDVPVDGKDRKAIQAHIRSMKKSDGKISDMTTFILIEQCRTWHKAYLEELAIVEKEDQPQIEKV